MRPGPLECLARSTDHRPATVAAADPKRQLGHRRDDDHAFGLFEELLWDVVRDVEDFLHHGPAILEPPLFFIVRGEADRTQEEAECEAERAKHVWTSLTNTTPVRVSDVNDERAPGGWGF